MRPLLVAAALLAVAPAPAFRIGDPRIDEASGLALGLRSSGVAYVQNDSGDTNRFFAVDTRTGATVATVTVPGATNVDWEDIAVAPAPGGVPAVWLADTGDNGAVRPEVRSYRVPEPRLRRTERDRSVRAARAQEWRLAYPDGPHDAEALAVTPAGTAYVITKSLLGRSTVYRVPPTPDRHRVQRLRPVGTIELSATGAANPFGPVGELAVTGASVSRDGSVLAVRTYAAAYLWRVSGGDVAAALRHRPRRVPLPEQRQGEGIALRGDRTALVDSEGTDQPVYAVPLPALPVPSRSPTPSPAPSSGRPSASGRDGGAARAHPGAPLWPLPVAAGAALLLGLAIAGFTRRRGRIKACRSPRSTRR
ncbi:MAG TPA: hypothetical protein VHC23_10395 [Jatrophihabitans sp.]|nr:hypothetical protein [Jatrophihabitans sp.]